MNIKERILQPKNLWHLGAVALFLLISCIYFFPALKGYSVKQGDVTQWLGASQEIADYRNNDGEQILWTNSMFSGMPSTQISMAYNGREIPIFLRNMMSLWLPRPISILFLYLVGFYILAMSFRVKPLIGIVGSIAFALSSYFIVIIEAGHVTKAYAIAFAPMLIAGMIFAYRRKNWWLGVGLSALFMCLELLANHLQITYYMAMIMVVIGIVELIRYIKKGQLAKFFIITGGLVVAYTLALLVNIGNIRGTAEYAEHTIRGGSELTPPAKEETATTKEAAMIEFATSLDGKKNKGLDFEYITHWSYGKGETFTFLVPNYKGGESGYLQNYDKIDDHIKEADAQWRPYVKQSNQYWGDQPGTSGPVYIGIIVILLALLGLVFIKDKIKWALLAITVLCILLSWGKNLPGFTQFFIDYMPGYDKFRTVTMILVIAELCLPVLAILYLHRLYKAREEMLKNIKGFYIVSGILLFFLLLMTMIPGTFNTFLSAGELNSLESITDPAQYETMSQYYENIELVRSSIFTADVWRSILFLVLGIAVIFAYIKKFINIIPLTGILALLILADLASVNRRYLGVESKGKGYKQWAENYKYKYPFAAGDGETAIYNMETAANPAIMASCDSAMNVMKSTFDKDLKGKEKTRMLDWAKYRTFNRLTNFRVLEEGNPFNSSYASYFFKSLGGYHGAKLGRYQELIEYHLGFRNPSVLDMLNMKYSVIPKRDKAGEIIGSQLGSVNPNAMGNVWFAKDIKVVENADEEIVAMDAFRAYEIDAIGNYPVVIDGQISQGTKVVRGQESIGFIDVNLNSGFPPKLDTFAIQVPFQAIEGDMELCLIKDSVQGLNWAYNNMIDSTFDRVLVVSGTGIQGWDVHTTTVVDKRYKENISKDSYSGEGSINQVSYHPDHLVYRSSSSEDQLAVFSEIHYPIGWTAYLDGSEVPISRVNYVLRAIEVPAGDHKIEFVFESETYNSSGVMAWSATILILVLIAFGVYKEKDHKEEEESLEKEIEGEQSVSVE